MSKQVVLFVVALVAVGVYAMLKPGDAPPPPKPPAPGSAQATFGGGCFWCTEAVFAELKGVSAVVSGYTGGKTDNPTYDDICNGDTGHAEVIQITYDPNVVAYADLLEIFWATHDPTTLNRQGADRGTQYRSVIYYHDEEQKRLAEEYKRKVNDSGAYSDPVVTEIAPLGKFYSAEGYHQSFYARNPQQGYCAALIPPKLAKLKKAFADKLR